jgi:parvulin-like peptidyl-prolyl isomerase
MQSRKKTVGLIVSIVIVVVLLLVLAAHLIVFRTQDNAVRSALIQTFPYALVTVDGDRIRLSDFEQRIADTQYYYDRQDEYGVEVVPRPSQDDLTAAVLQSMIDRVLLEQIAQEYGVNVTSEQVAQYYDDVIVAQESGGEAVVEADLERFYGWSPEEFQQNVLRTAVLREEIARALVDDERLNEPVRQYAQDVLDQVTQEGAVFENIATEVSEDAETASSGGFLGTIQRGQFDPLFEEAVFAAEPNTIVGPVRSIVGFHIIRVYEKDDANETAQVQHILLKTESVDDLLTQRRDDVDTSSVR